MAKRSGIDLFGDDVSAKVLTEIHRWHSDPELGQIALALHAHSNRKAFMDTYAEAMVARHLLARGWELRFEIPTPAGRRADFEVRRDDLLFYLHVKQIDTERPIGKRLKMTSRVRALEKIRRPYTAQVRWIEHASAEQMQRLVTMASEFLLGAHVGDEMRMRDERGREFGGVRITAPAPGGESHVHVTIGSPTGFIDAAPRIRRLMHRAYDQFMPRAQNVIVICSSHIDDQDDVDTALLGSHIERWDAYPPRGKRVAHGRGSDGFWTGQRFAQSKVAGWFCFGPKDVKAQGRIWVRKNAALDRAAKDSITQLFDPENR